MADGTKRATPDRKTARAQVVACWLCGTRLQTNKMMPDGGDACDDIRWYCLDTQGCAQRWTSARRLQTGGERTRSEGAEESRSAPDRFAQAEPVTSGVGLLP
jgi:hypothetical protein